MVLFHLKTTKETEFIYETQTTAEVTQVIEDCVAIHNAILRIREIVAKLKDLIKMGPMEDDNERRNPPENKEVLERAIADAEAAVSAEHAAKKQPLTVEGVSEELARLGGAITIVYPGGLPKSEPLKKLIEGGPVQNELDVKMVQFWVIRKSYQRGKHIFDYTGKNEKQTFVAKFTGPESGPPPRDVSVSQEAQIKWMSAMHKKAEELKRIDKDDDNSYLDSEWANPRGLKNTFQGINDVDWKPH